MNSIDNIDISVFSNTLEENPKVKKISIPVFEAIFYGLYRDKLKSENISTMNITPELIKELKSIDGFLDACNDKTTSKINVNNRLNLAYNFFIGKGF